jgi:uncharacterized protein
MVCGLAPRLYVAEGAEIAVSDLWTAIGLIFVIEGIIYAAFPVAMKRMVVSILSLPTTAIRTAGLISAIFGLVVVWLIRG